MVEEQPERELRGCDRFEWEQIVLRTRWNGVIPATKNRGSVTGVTFRAVALAWASHADGKTGRGMFPSEGVIAVEAETSIKTVQAVKAKLVELGLVQRIRAGYRRTHNGDEYRLTLPSDLLDAIDVLTPAAVKTTGARLADERRGKRSGPAEPPPTDPDMGGPPVPPRPVDNPSMGGSPVPPQDEAAEFYGGTAGPPIPVYGGTAGPPMGVPPVPHTKSDHPRRTNNQTAKEVRTHLAVVGDTGPPQDPDSECEDSRCSRGFVLIDANRIERCAHPSHAPPANVTPLPIRQTA